MDADSQRFMKETLALARRSTEQGGFPAGALIVKDNHIIGHGLSIGWTLNDPTAHGEMAAIRAACAQLKANDLAGCTLYASLESCLMCLGAQAWSGIRKVVYACGKNRVLPEYYAGHYHTHEINQTLLTPIEIVHAKEFEEEALAIVREWEKTRA